MNKYLLKIVPAGLLLLTLFSACNNKPAEKNPQEVTDTVITDEETGALSQIPQIISIRKTPDILTDCSMTYTVTLQTDKQEVAEFSMDGTTWQKENVFQNIAGGKKYIFYARNTKNNSLKDPKEMFFEACRNVPVPTKEQLNNYLKLIADYNDEATDDIRKYLGNDCTVKGAGNIQDVRQLILETQNGTNFSVTNIEVTGGIVKAITVSKI
ncbi:hypothetical protein FACS1894145_4590 [Bacteroidia bacterium]|nr:hypothetical protein FACS1894145_4590 [Bacteroidia bacterium]